MACLFAPNLRRKDNVGGGGGGGGKGSLHSTQFSKFFFPATLVEVKFPLADPYIETELQDNKVLIAPCFSLALYT